MARALGNTRSVRDVHFRVGQIQSSPQLVGESGELKRLLEIPPACRRLCVVATPPGRAVSGRLRLLVEFSAAAPYAIRARLALSAAGLAVELREVKPPGQAASFLRCHRRHGCRCWKPSEQRPARSG